MARFDGSGPVARYWLSRCEGFAVRGAASGIVTALRHEHDPHSTSHLVVRTRGLRTKVLPADAVAAVDPEARTIMIARAPRRTLQLPKLPAPPRVPRPPLGPARDAFAEAVRRAQPHGANATRIVQSSFRLLAREVFGAAALLVRSASWRPFARSVRFATTKLPPVRWPTSSRRRTTSSRRRRGRRTSRAARTTSST